MAEAYLALFSKASARYNRRMFEMPVESGRLVVCFRRRLSKIPMAEACFVSDSTIPYGPMAAAVAYERVEGKPGTLGARQFFVGDLATAKRLSQAANMTMVTLFAHAPRIVAGDHGFLYQKAIDPMSEGARALRACEGSRRFGSFREDTSDVGCCFRTGWRRCIYQVRQVEGGIAAQIIKIEEPEADDSGDL
jgi:hypothetical protein